MLLAPTGGDPRLERLDLGIVALDLQVGAHGSDELRRIVVQKPEALVTAEPGLATVPPEQLATASEEAEPAVMAGT